MVVSGLKYWILVGHTPIEVDHDEWSRWLGYHESVVDDLKRGLPPT